METRQQRLIRVALEKSDGKRAYALRSESSSDEPPAPTSLRGKALGRTDDGYVPRTLTPHEWEDYYRELGVPAEHRRGEEDPDARERSDGLWQSFLRVLGIRR